MAFRLLPREGLTLEAFFAPIGLALFEPLITAPLLFAVLRHPDTVKSILPISLAPYVDSSSFILGLKGLVAFNVLKKSSNFLSRLALNNFVTDKSWDWTKEIVVITGGSYGIGESVARMLAEKCIKVIVLARTKPKNDLRRLSNPITGICELY
jgi:all-trans-retinol dehydrogenase (NAD+)